MSTPVEFDFFGIERESRTPSAENQRRKIINDIATKLNPEVVKSVIASAAVDQNSSPTGSLNRTAAIDSETSKAPMTIFYNGTVTAFDLPPHQAEKILQLAQKRLSKEHVKSEPTVKPKDLPIARKKTLQYFLEKRKERIMDGSLPSNEAQNSTGNNLML